MADQREGIGRKYKESMNSYHAEPDRERIVPTKTISVWLDTGNEYRKKYFRCTNCGLVVLEYFSDVRVVFIGSDTPLPDNPSAVYKHPIVVRCKRCKQDFKFE